MPAISTSAAGSEMALPSWLIQGQASQADRHIHEMPHNTLSLKRVETRRYGIHRGGGLRRDTSRCRAVAIASEASSAPRAGPLMPATLPLCDRRLALFVGRTRSSRAGPAVPPARLETMEVACLSATAAAAATRGG